MKTIKDVDFGEIIKRLTILDCGKYSTTKLFLGTQLLDILYDLGFSTCDRDLYNDIVSVLNDLGYHQGWKDPADGLKSYAAILNRSCGLT